MMNKLNGIGIRELVEEELDDVSGAWLDSFDFGTFWSMGHLDLSLPSIQVVNVPFPDLHLPPITEVVGLPPIDLAGLDLGLGGGVGSFLPNLSGLGTLPIAPADNVTKSEPPITVTARNSFDIGPFHIEINQQVMDQIYQSLANSVGGAVNWWAGGGNNPNAPTQPAARVPEYPIRFRLDKADNR